MFYEDFVAIKEAVSRPGYVVGFIGLSKGIVLLDVDSPGVMGARFGSLIPYTDIDTWYDYSGELGEIRWVCRGDKEGLRKTIIGRCPEFHDLIMLASGCSRDICCIPENYKEQVLSMAKYLVGRLS